MRRSKRVQLGWVLGILGLVQLGGLVAFDAFGRAATGQELVDDARPTVGREGIVELRRQLDQLDLVFDQSVTEVFPSLGAEVGLTPVEFELVVTRDYPAIGVMLDRVDEISEAFQKTVENLEAHQDDFEAADNLPAPGVPMTVLPWALVAVSLVVIGAGIACTRLPSRWPVVAVGVLGVALVVGQLALQVPQKSAQAQDLLDALTATEASAIKTRDQFEVTAAFAGELIGSFVPDLARARGLSTEQFVIDLGQRFPDLAAALPEVQPTLDRLELDVAFREEHYADIADVQPLPLAAMAWAVAGIGALLALSAAWVLRSERHKRRKPGAPGAPGGGASSQSGRGALKSETTVEIPLQG